jgi:hypothetical protein
MSTPIVTNLRQTIVHAFLKSELHACDESTKVEPKIQKLIREAAQLKVIVVRIDVQANKCAARRAAHATPRCPVAAEPAARRRREKMAIGRCASSDGETVYEVELYLNVSGKGFADRARGQPRPCCCECAFWQKAKPLGAKGPCKHIVAVLQHVVDNHSTVRPPTPGASPRARLQTPG